MDHFWLDFCWHLSETIAVVPVLVSIRPWVMWIFDPGKETLPRPMWNQRIKITHSTYHLIWSELSKQMWNMDLMFSELSFPGLWLKDSFWDNICSLSSAWCCQQRHLSIEKTVNHLYVWSHWKVFSISNHWRQIHTQPYFAC